MIGEKPQQAMVLAAGYGRRMLPLTLTVPKPLLTVGGRTMLDQALDRLSEAGVRRVVVNCSHLGEQVAALCAARRDMAISLSPEGTPLETGGGVKHALPLLADAPFFVVNADLPWRDKGAPALARLAAQWRPAMMDMLLLVMPLVRAKGFTRGDFALLPDGRLRRAGGGALDHVFIGVTVAKPELYRGVTAAAFSNNLLFDQAEAAGRLYGCVHAGSCFHVGTPEDLALANRLLEEGRGWEG